MSKNWNFDTIESRVLVGVQVAMLGLAGFTLGHLIYQPISQAHKEHKDLSDPAQSTSVTAQFQTAGAVLKKADNYDFVDKASGKEISIPVKSVTNLPAPTR